MFGGGLKEKRCVVADLFVSKEGKNDRKRAAPLLWFKITMCGYEVNRCSVLMCR